jgi:hypothetical protein
MVHPKRTGFYWARWLAAERNTRDGSMLTPSQDWEVVWVFQNSTDPQDDEFHRVLVIGVESTQPIENFEWGPGPLNSPGRRTSED